MKAEQRDHSHRRIQACITRILQLRPAASRNTFSSRQLHIKFLLTTSTFQGSMTLRKPSHSAFFLAYLPSILMKNRRVAGYEILKVTRAVRISFHWQVLASIIKFSAYQTYLFFALHRTYVGCHLITRGPSQLPVGPGLSNRVIIPGIRADMDVHSFPIS
jgi:hypothetical protein